MERYTEKHYGENGYYLICSGNCETLNCGDCGIVDKIVDRLAVYEDTGLEPEEIELLEKQRDLYVDACGELPLKRIRELAQADREGRCVVLPCKVGDTVYQVDDIRVYALEVRNLIYDAGILAFDESTIGKTVFLTRAEAEAALRREQDG